MRPLPKLLLLALAASSLCAPPLAGQPLAGQPPDGPWEGVGRLENGRHGVFAGGGALAGAFLVSAVCDGPGGQKKLGVCGRSRTGSAFNGVILGALGGHVTHLLTLERDAYGRSPSAALPGVELLSVRADSQEPCPPEPEPCPRGGDDGGSKRKYLILSVGAGAMLGGAITQAICSSGSRREGAPGRRDEEGGPCSTHHARTVFLGAAAGALVGVAVGNFVYYLSHGNVDYAASPSVDLVTCRVGIG